MVLLTLLIVTAPVPLFETVPVIAQSVSVMVIGLFVLYVRLPVIVTPVKLLALPGPRWLSLRCFANTAPLASVTGRMWSGFP
jgi:hypothetical protein